MNTPLPEDRIAPSRPASLDNLENLAGLAEDLHSCATPQAGADLEALIHERFGPEVSVNQVRDAFDALRAISLDLPEPAHS